MKPSYEDLTTRLGNPSWWDDGGVPRYDPFKPSMLGVYDTYAALLKVECQACGMVLKVGVGIDRNGHMLRSGDKPTLPTEDGVGSFHYGDPPNHPCTGAGETMNSLPREVVEFWRRDADEVGRDWTRDPDHEVTWEDGVDAIFGAAEDDDES